MGGAIVLELGLNPPEGLQGIVVVGSGAKLPVTRAIFQMLSENPEAFFETIGRFAFSPAAPVAMVERFVLVARQCPPPVIFNDFQACDHFDIRNRLAEIKIPTLVLCGEEDQLTPVKYSRYLHEGITTSSLTLIPNAGHMVMMEQPDPLNRGIESFLATLGA
jgi:pimeloyl-ACP methyl ester carboxylesterase